MKKKTSFRNALGALLVAATMAVTFAGSAQADNWHGNGNKGRTWDHDNNHRGDGPHYQKKYDWRGHPIYRPVYRPVAYRPVYYPRPVYYYPVDYYYPSTTFSFIIR